MWTISLGEELDPEMRGRISGVQGQMVKFEYVFGINILQILLRHSDNLSKMQLVKGQFRIYAELKIGFVDSKNTQSLYDIIGSQRKNR